MLSNKNGEIGVQLCIIKKLLIFLLDSPINLISHLNYIPLINSKIIIVGGNIVNKRVRLGIIIATIIIISLIMYQKNNTTKSEAIKIQEKHKNNIEAAITSTRIKVEGMFCESCVNKIKTELKSIPGIRAVKLDFDSKLLDVKYVIGQTRTKLIMEKINALGYKTSIPEGRSKLESLKFDVSFQ